jgi:hypothetical protein
MLLKQLETLGMVHVPTCLVGPGLVRHSLVPDLLGPALAHHGLELGLASLRAILDHLRVGLGPGLDHHGLDPGICWRSNLGSAGDFIKESSCTSKAVNVLGVIAISQTCRCFQGDQIQNSFCENLHGH